MGNIRPKTYHEVLRFKRCLSLKRYIPEMDDALLLKLYDFLGESPGNRITVANGMIAFINGKDTVVDSVMIAQPIVGSLNFYEIINMSALTMNVSRPFTSSGGSDGGGSSNNNNNG